MDGLKPSEIFIKSSEAIVDDMNISPKVKEDLKRILNGQKPGSSHTNPKPDRGEVV